MTIEDAAYKGRRMRIVERSDGVKMHYRVEYQTILGFWRPAISKWRCSYAGCEKDYDLESFAIARERIVNGVNQKRYTNYNYFNASERESLSKLSEP